MKIDALQIKINSDEIDLCEFKSLTIKVGSSFDNNNLTIEFDEDGKITKYTKKLSKLKGWEKIKAILHCALFGHCEDVVLTVPIFIYDEWKMFKAKIDYCSRCQQDFK